MGGGGGRSWQHPSLPTQVQKHSPSGGSDSPEGLLSQTHPLGQLQPHPKAHEFFPCRGAVAGPSTRTLVQDKLVVATTVVPSTRLSLGPLRGDTGAWSPNMHQLPLGLQP